MTTRILETISRRGLHDAGLMDILAMREAPDLVGRKGLEVLDDSHE